MLKPTIHTLKDLGSRRIVGYRASYAQYSADGSTRAQATNALERTINLALGNLQRGTGLHYWREHLMIIMPMTHDASWRYWIDMFDNPNFYGPGGYATREEAEDAALQHLAQTLWTLETDDVAFLQAIPTASVRRELATWIGCQRMNPSLHRRVRLKALCPRCISTPPMRAESTIVRVPESERS